jgi:hypothetical protein
MKANWKSCTLTLRRLVAPTAILVVASLVVACWTGSASAQGKKASSGTKVDAGGEHGDGFVAEASTKIDFSETSIDGKMQAPQGFFLQGKQSQSLTQMVKLRPNFRSELRNSRSAVKSLVK